jgi:polyisoprenoid-binding protein YceI
VRNKWTWIIGIPVLLVVVFVGGPFVYINFIRDDAPDRLELSTGTTQPSGSSTTAADTATVDGEWSVRAGSIVGYRAREILFGQDAEAAGRTEDVTGVMTIASSSVDDASFTADLTTLESDSDNRDNQVQGRILNTAEFPNATFALTEPIELESIPGDRVPITVQATGDLTIHGTTRSVTFALAAQRIGETIEVNGSIPITWSEYNIGAPSGGPAQVADDGEMEFLITFERA